ncbi:LolA family protein [Ferruginibacter sp. SUN002]|uniref:LolA family protein n=1 Tax=Ferruginibacter sp. SUN002 TaxID=2937789 RepID=UPI003D35F851
MKKILMPLFALCTVMLISSFVQSQDAESLLQKVKAKIDKVNNYQASGKMKTNVAFLKVPVANVTIYFKKPDKLKIKNEKGLSFVPKGAVNINLNSILSSNKYSVIDAGTDKIGGKAVRVIKLLPEDDNADVVLSTLYIDETNLVIKKAKTTTRENGSYELEMTYGKYTEYGLPDKVVFSFNTKDYKLPKGVTFDFDDGTSAKKPVDASKKKKGKAEITFSSYTINKGIDDNVFK